MGTQYAVAKMATSSPAANDLQLSSVMAVDQSRHESHESCCFLGESVRDGQATLHADKLSKPCVLMTVASRFAQSREDAQTPS